MSVCCTSMSHTSQPAYVTLGGFACQLVSCLCHTCQHLLISHMMVSHVYVLGVIAAHFTTYSRHLWRFCMSVGAVCHCHTSPILLFACLWVLCVTVTHFPSCSLHVCVCCVSQSHICHPAQGDLAENKQTEECWRKNNEYLFLLFIIE